MQSARLQSPCSHNSCFRLRVTEIINHATYLQDSNAVHLFTWDERMLVYMENIQRISAYVM